MSWMLAVPAVMPDTREEVSAQRGRVYRHGGGAVFGKSHGGEVGVGGGQSGHHRGVDDVQVLDALDCAGG